MIYDFENIDPHMMDTKVVGFTKTLSMMIISVFMSILTNFSIIAYFSTDLMKLLF